MFNQYVKYSPVGEYIRLIAMERLAKGPATVEEIDRLAREVVEMLGVEYDWRVWPKLLEREVSINGGVVELSREGRWIFEQTREEVEEYILKTWGWLWRSLY
ncbi:MAG: hypothetical protein QXT13_07625 [Pyrobaculum sp.]